jgi:TolB-like protein
MSVRESAHIVLEAFGSAGPAATPLQVEFQMRLLERVTASLTFRFADRQRSFLRYIVAEAVQQRAERLKEYVIGMEVFDRSASFDPRLDSIVRTGAHKLRAKLAKYYATEGKGDAIRIELPVGQYVPIFVDAVTRPRTDIPAASARELRKPLRLLVLPFDDRAKTQAGELFSDTVTDELSHALASVAGIEVVARSCAFRFKSRGVDISEVGQHMNVDVVIEGSVRKISDRLRILVQADDPASGCALWSQSYESGLDELADVQQIIARSIACKLLSDGPSMSRDGRQFVNRASPVVPLQRRA